MKKTIGAIFLMALSALLLAGCARQGKPLGTVLLYTSVPTDTANVIKAAFETLVEAGYPPELCYFECMHELKLIVDLFYQGGINYMRYSVSNTAEYGDLTRGPRIIDQQTKAEMWQILEEIRDGSFAREWILENQAGRPSFNASRRHEAEHEIEDVGKKLRAMMPWLK